MASQGITKWPVKVFINKKNAYYYLKELRMISNKHPDWLSIKNKIPIDEYFDKRRDISEQLRICEERLYENINDDLYTIIQYYLTKKKIILDDELELESDVESDCDSLINPFYDYYNEEPVKKKLFFNEPECC